MRLKSIMCLGVIGLFLGACQAQGASSTYSYHNFLKEDVKREFATTVQDYGVSSDDWERIDTYIKRYNSENKGYEAVTAEWTQAKLGEDQNEFVTFMNEKEYNQNLSHFTNDINCRRAVFLLTHKLFKTPETVAEMGLPEHTEFSDLKTRHADLSQADQQLYSLLFGDNNNLKSTDDLIQLWKDAGIVFPEKLKVVSVVQNAEGAVVNFHTALAYEKGGEIYVFEKLDPTLPYKLSKYQSWKDLQSHWFANRFQSFKDTLDILVNDKKIEVYF